MIVRRVVRSTSTRTPPKICVFLDERVAGGDTSRHRLIVGCFVVGASRWKALHDAARRVGQVRGTRRLDEIGKLLAHLEGFGLLTYGDLPAELVPAGEIDGTNDIPTMARSDNVWSHAVLAAGAAVLASLPGFRVDAAALDFHYDPKSLTAPHRYAIERALRETLPEIAREAPQRPERPTPYFTVGRVEQVPKPAPGIAPDSLQLGTNIAHHLCSQADALIRGRVIPRVLVCDHTQARVTMVSKFT